MAGQAAVAATMAEYVSTSGSGAVTMAGATVVMGLAYKAVRPFFKSAVNCHFCNTDTKVKYSDRNSWFCPYCGQYNGFTEDGDYNQTDHLITSTPVRSCAPAGKPTKPATNGLCKNCNLNQELKLSQLSTYSGDDKELEEYTAHLERVYRLCASCEEVVRLRLEEQDSVLKPGIIEHRLETSRLAAHQQNSHGSRLSFLHELGYLQIAMILAFLVFQLIPQYEDFLPNHVRLVVGDIMNHEKMISEGFAILLALAGLMLARLSPVQLLNVVPLFLHCFNVERNLKLVSFCVLSLVDALVVVVGHKRSRYSARGGLSRKIVDTLTAKMMALESSEDLDETLTSSRDSLVSKSSTEAKEMPKQTPQQTIGLFTKLNGFVNAVSHSNSKDNNSQQHNRRRVNSPLIWSGDENTLNHEFVVESSGRDCDLASLSLGREHRDNRTTSPSPFSQRVYSPEPNPDGIKFSPGRPILRPARLTSWVAAGYWSPPETRIFGETLSRSSSQSSGFVSTGLVSGSPSLENLSQFSNLQTNHASLPTSPRNSILGDCDRNSVLSAPAMKTCQEFCINQSFITQRRHTTDDQLSDSSLGRTTQLDVAKMRPVAESSPTVVPVSHPPNSTAPATHHQSLNDKLSFTVTITPVGFILAASLSVNFALMYFYMSNK